jgi:hypothetical protein
MESAQPVPASVLVYASDELLLLLLDEDDDEERPRGSARLPVASRFAKIGEVPRLGVKPAEPDPDAKASDVCSILDANPAEPEADAPDCAEPEADAPDCAGINSWILFAKRLESRSTPNTLKCFLGALVAPSLWQCIALSQGTA